MTCQPRIIATATIEPPYSYDQSVLRTKLCDLVLGPDWPERPDMLVRADRIARIFAASRVERRSSAVDLLTYYDRPHSTRDRMEQYRHSAYPLARAALLDCLAGAGSIGAPEITDFFVVSCTGYDAPGLDILLARDLGMSPTVRRVVIGHMGCYGALVGVRQALAVLRAYRQATVALLAVELCSLHFSATQDADVLTSFALFGDGITAALLSAEPGMPGPVLVDAHCVTVFDAASQMSWRITDEGFRMGLSSRVPVTLRQQVGPAVEQLLGPHALAVGDVTHWLIHPGGPSIVEAIQHKLALSDEQVQPSWAVLRDRGNCSSATVLMMLDDLLRSGRARHGEWCVIMAFGPGLTLEMCLLHF